MHLHTSWSRKTFEIANTLFLGFLGILCVLPLVYVAAVSFSSSAAAAGGLVYFWPVDFNLESYTFVMNKPEFLLSIGVTLQRVVLGLAVNMLVTILIAYPLSKDNKSLKGRTLYVWIFVFTALFHGGLIPVYMTMKTLGLMDTLWALILHNAVPVFNVVILLNFFRGIPKELEEAAFMDGAGHTTTLWRVYVPLSLPSLATIILFACVGHWNAWFDGIIFMNSPDNYPLQSYLYTVVNAVNTLLANSTDMDALAAVSSRTVTAAQILLGALPILALYPFLQRYFMHGMVLGSVKE